MKLLRLYHSEGLYRDCARCDAESLAGLLHALMRHSPITAPCFVSRRAGKVFDLLQQQSGHRVEDQRLRDRLHGQSAREYNLRSETACAARTEVTYSPSLPPTPP